MNGTKKSNDIGTPMKILFAKTMVFSKFLCSKYENKIVIKLAIGKEIRNPDSTGFLKDNQLANEIKTADINTLKINNKLLAEKIFNFGYWVSKRFIDSVYKLDVVG